MSNKKLKGFKQFTAMPVPRQVPRQVPAGTKYINGIPQDNVPDGYVRVPDHVSGGTKLIKEGISGAIIGGTAGLVTAGPLGGLVGAYAGHKIQQKSSANRSVVDAALANYAADFLDKRSAKKALKVNPNTKRFRSSIASRLLRNYATRKSGGIYAVSQDNTEPIDGLVSPQQQTIKKTSAATKGNVVKFPGRNKAAPKTGVNPIHVNHPGQGSFQPPIETTPAGQQAAAKRMAVQKAIAARIRAQKTSASKPSFDAPGTRQKKERVNSSTILVPEEKGK